MPQIFERPHNQPISIGAGISIVLLLVGLCHYVCADGELKGQLPETRIVDIKKVFVKSYRDIYQGNLADLETNRKRAAQLRGQAVLLAKRQGSSQKAQELDQLSKLYTALADRNETIVYGLEQGFIAHDTRKAMEELVAIEVTINKVAGQVPAREWLTLQEVEKIVAAEGKHRPREAGIMPFKRKDWRVNGRIPSESVRREQ